MRCHEEFSRREDHDAHLRQDPDKMCKARKLERSPNAVEDETVSAVVGEKLRSRAEHFDWTSLWLVLFPGDKPENIPAPCGFPLPQTSETVQN